MKKNIKLCQLKNNLHCIGSVLIVPKNELVKEIKTHISPNISTDIILKKIFEYFGEQETLTCEQSAKIVKFFAKVHNFSLTDSPLEIYLNMAEIETQHFQKEHLSLSLIKATVDTDDDNIDPVYPNLFITRDPKIKEQFKRVNWLQSYQSLLLNPLSYQECIDSINEGKYSLNSAKLIAIALLCVEQSANHQLIFDKAFLLVKKNNLQRIKSLFWTALYELPIAEFLSAAIAIVHYDFLVKSSENKQIEKLSVVSGVHDQWLRNSRIAERINPLPPMEIQKPVKPMVTIKLNKIAVNPQKLTTRKELINAVYQLFGVAKVERTKAFNLVKKWKDSHCQNLNLRTTDGWRELLDFALSC